MTIDASSTSVCSSASRKRSSCSTTRSRPPRAATSSPRSSFWKCWRVSPTSAELARDVVLRARIGGRGEDLVRGVVLDELAREHERRRVRHARGLLHIVRDDDDRVALLELGDELLDTKRRDRVQRRARLVHEDHLGLDRDGAGDAQALLLAARQADARLREAVLDLLPQAGAAQ